jgi:hypothetical protein
MCPNLIIMLLTTALPIVAKPFGPKPDRSGYRPGPNALCAYKRIAGLPVPKGTAGALQKRVIKG